jgi:DNA-binding transcriptional LysR family regulator
MSALVIRRPVGGFPNPDSCLTLSTHSHRAGAFTFDLGPIRGLSTHQIFEEKLCLAVPSDHSFAALPSIRAEQPAGEPLIATPQTWPRPYATPTCASSAPAASRQPLGWKRNFSRRVAEDLGVALVPTSMSRLGLPDVVFLALGGRADGCQCHCVARRQSQPDVASTPGGGCRILDFSTISALALMRSFGAAGCARVRSQT